MTLMPPYSIIIIKLPSVLMFFIKIQNALQIKGFVDMHVNML